MHLISFLLRLLSSFGKRGLLFIILGLPLQLATLSSFAQYTKLLDFGNTDNGVTPYSSLISDGTFLYGTTSEGGSFGVGTIYKIKPDGTGFAKLFDFDGDNTGSTPVGSLLFDGTYIYGMASGGGADGHGTIFKLLPDGTGFVNLFDFVYLSNGAFPYGSLFSDGTFLYGMTSQGGSKFYGTLFKIMPDGSGYTTLLEFDNTTNGSTPYGSLISDGTFLYGMTNGGFSSLGSVFKIKPDGTGYTKLLDFTGTANGKNPYGSLFWDGTFLYGTTLSGGSNNFGTIFKILPNGTGYVNLLNFNNTSTGGYPIGSLSSDGTFLYGTTTGFGLNGRGTIFKIMPNGTGFVKLLDNDVGTTNLPEGTLLINGTVLYGVKSGGGAGVAPFAPGTIFKINPDGSGYTKLFSFKVAGNSPPGSLVSDGTFLYGMAAAGGLFNYGTVFKIKPDGTGYVDLLDFLGTTNGGRPCGRPILVGGSLYGMTSQGGTNDYGTIFKINPDGTGYVKLLDFDVATNGENPNGSLISDGTFLYGMTTNGGPGNFYGSVFKIMLNGTGFVNLHYFDDLNGAYPNGSLFSVGGFLYGMTYQGGTNGGWGTLFKVDLVDGTTFAKLIDFDYDNTGANPKGSLTFDGTFFYGMTSNGGANGNGTIFKIKPDGTGYSKLLDFDGASTGGLPNGSLTSVGSFLYGMTSYGGLQSSGTLFRIKPDGTGFLKMLDFNDGQYPQASLISDGTFLYGTTSAGGAHGLGILFKTTLAPFATITDFSPTEGVEGTIVTINGTGFDPTPANNIVKFNNTTASVKSSTASTITVIVPVGAASGPISVTAGTTATSLDDFNVTSVALMFNGSVKNCNVQFVGPDNIGYTDDIETFLPVNPSDKVKISWSSFSVGDSLFVYDGPTTASPLLARLSGTTLPADMVATGPGGELTFLFRWEDSSSDWEANISCQSSGPGITIGTQPFDFTACAGGLATFSTSASGTTNITYQWQYSSDGINPFADIPNGGGYSNATTATLSVSTVGTFGAGRYRCRINGDLAAEVVTNDEGLFINPRPSPPVTVNPGPVCGPSSFDLTVSGGTNGQYVWYTAPTGGTGISGQRNDVYVTPLLSATTTYYVSIDDGTCESTRTPVIATIQICNPPTITSTVSTAFIEGIVTIDLTNLIADPDDNLDLSTLQIVAQPGSGAVASLSGLILTIDYTGVPYTSTDIVSIEVCDLTALCTTQQISIEFAGDITIYNAVSPNGDGKNEFLFLKYIEVIPSKQQNQVRIYNRWGDEVFSITNYNNHDRVFAGTTNDGTKLPTGTYFYKISFASGEKSRTGFLELKY